MTTLTTLNSTRPAGVYPRPSQFVIKQLAPFSFSASITWQPHTCAEGAQKIACGPEQQVQVDINQSNLLKKVHLRDTTTGVLQNVELDYKTLMEGLYAAFIQEAGFSDLGEQ